MAVITICRGTKSGGERMAECLAEHLGYPIIGREIVRDAAEELGVSVEKLEEKIGGPPGLWDRFTSWRRLYIIAVQAELAQRVAGGNLVYHGIAGSMILRDAPCSLCLRLIAPMERRVQVVVDETGLTPAMAERYVREVDEARARWVRVMYGEDIADPALYDMVIKLDTLTIEGACRLTAAAVDRPEFTVDDEARARLRDFRIACQVRLALARDPELRSLDLDAKATDGVVKVTGQAPVLKSGRMGDTIAEIAQSVPDVAGILLEVEWFDPYP